MKRKYEQDLNERDEFIKDYFKGSHTNKNLFVLEPNDSNVLQCYMCGIDTFYFWISEHKKNQILNFLCIRCAHKNVEQLRHSHYKVNFYFKYEPEDMEDYFRRLEGKIFDPEYKDTGLQVKLLLKTDWPEVRTKQDLIEEKLPCMLYDGRPTDISL